MKNRYHGITCLIHMEQLKTYSEGTNRVATNVMIWIPFVKPRLNALAQTAHARWLNMMRHFDCVIACVNHSFQGHWRMRHNICAFYFTLNLLFNLISLSHGFWRGSATSGAVMRQDMTSRVQSNLKWSKKRTNYRSMSSCFRSHYCCITTMRDCFKQTLYGCLLTRLSKL